jgi:hypothetical protein
MYIHSYIHKMNFHRLSNQHMPKLKVVRRTVVSEMSPSYCTVGHVDEYYLPVAFSCNLVFQESPTPSPSATKRSGTSQASRQDSAVILDHSLFFLIDFLHSGKAGRRKGRSERHNIFCWSCYLQFLKLPTNRENSQEYSSLRKGKTVQTHTAENSTIIRV